jgi:CubicO group peptidase (beta-lactamase class C family)
MAGIGTAIVVGAVLVASCGGGDWSTAGRESDTRSTLTSGNVASDRQATAKLFADIKRNDPGCTVAVARDSKVLFAKGYGLASIKSRTPNTATTVMDIGSTSKQFTAFAILLLADEGKLSLDDDVHAFIPELPDYGAKVTLRQMMHHQSGIPDYITLLQDKIDERTTANDALAALKRAPKLEFSPGTKFSYSNSNYFLFSYVVERVAGMPLPQFLQTRVFQPAGIAAVMDPVGAVPHKAHSYSRAGAGWELADSKWEQVGDGAIQTTPTQLVKWATQYWAPTVGSAAADRGRLDGAVPEEPPSSDYGAGIERVTLPDGAEMLTHSGGWAGFSTVFATIPKERLAVAAICNDDGTVDVTAEQLLAIWRG